MFAINVSIPNTMVVTTPLTKFYMQQKLTLTTSLLICNTGYQFL